MKEIVYSILVFLGLKKPCNSPEKHSDNPDRFRLKVVTPWYGGNQLVNVMFTGNGVSWEYLLEATWEYGHLNFDKYWVAGKYTVRVPQRGDLGENIKNTFPTYQSCIEHNKREKEKVEEYNKHEREIRDQLNKQSKPRIL